MSSYRFCRTDDIGLLVDALNRCWAPSFPGDPPMTATAFKRSIRDLQVWCSSCMVAFAGADPIGVLIGAKRAAATLVHRIAVHPDHQRQGHGRHLLESLSSKLAILGPPRIVSEVPESLEAAGALFRAAGYTEETVLIDYVWTARETTGTPGGLVIPINVDDLAANGLLEPGIGETCWERSHETLMARKDEIEGLAVASEERIEACLLYIKDAADSVLLRLVADADGARMNYLLSRLPAQGLETLRFPKVHPAEFPAAGLDALGFRASDRHVVYGCRLNAHPNRGRSVS
jgi:GNAT superfamily N-acetyltransferase